ncbi:MAG: response regulator transcription factor [Oscillospiraceae bacterium]
MKKVLIIEDDLAIAEIEQAYLQISGFASDIETDGAQGMERALRDAYDLILLDLMLPGMDGFSICRALREKLDIPILMVTAKKEDIDKIKGLGLGADDYIVKPFSPGELVARVKTHLERYDRLTGNDGAAGSEREIVVGSLRIQPGAHRVFVKGGEVELKNKEYELLYFLMTNADIVFSKETLYERIWGMDSMGDSATVTVHIGRLREKIEDDPQQPRYIQTVWGAGYRFKA